MRIDFEGRHVVVSGATGELGFAVVDSLLEAGAICHVPCRDGKRAEKLTRLGTERVRVVGGIDGTDEQAIESFYADRPGLWASIHCLGGFAMGVVAQVRASEFSRMMDMNALSCFLHCREAVRTMRARGAGHEAGMLGRIVNVAAQPGLEPRRGAGMIAYTASKAAVAAITVALAEEVAAEGILVNAVAPSIMDTEANRRSMPQANPTMWARLEEVAATIVFLAAPQNRVTRGALVPVYGRT